MPRYKNTAIYIYIKTSSETVFSDSGRFEENPDRFEEDPNRFEENLDRFEEDPDNFSNQCISRSCFLLVPNCDEIF